MNDTKRKSTIGEDLQNLAIKNSALSMESREMKKQVDLRRGNSRKCAAGSCIDPKDKRNGDVKHYSQFEIAVDVLVKGVNEQEFEKRRLSTYTDILLQVLGSWKAKAQELEKRGLIRAESLRDQKGRILITAPWAVIAVEQFHLREFIAVYLQRKEGEGKEITRKDISGQISSIFSSVFKTFVGLGLAKRVPAAYGSTKTYLLSGKTHQYPHEKLHHLFIEGRKLCRRKQAGEFGGQRVARAPEDSGRERSQVLELPGRNDCKVTKKSIRIGPDGTITIEIFYC